MKDKDFTLFKRFFYIFIFIFLSVTSYSIFTNLSVQNNILTETNATPLTSKVIVVDAGHGLPDEGAVGFNGTTEEAINLAISLKLQKLLETSGAKVILTRSDENGIYSLDSKSIREKKISDIKNRVNLGNNSNADIFVSIHLNKYPPSEIYRGWQTFYQANNTDSKNLSNLIQTNINKNIDYKNTRKPMKITDVYIMNNVKIPSVIVECGFLSNPEETTLLQDENYQSKIAWGIFIGIQDYFYNKTVENVNNS